jgi:hypothetical protein
MNGMNRETEYYEQFGGLRCSDVDDKPSMSDVDDKPSFSDTEEASLSDVDDKPGFSGAVAVG